MQTKNYYEVLGISKTATQDEIKKQYRNLAKRLHPDVHKTEKHDPEAEFKEITEAYETLSDNQKKHQYDQFGNTDAPFNRGNAQDPFANFNPQDFFNASFFNNGFQGFSNQQGHNRNQFNLDGEDIQIAIELELKDILHDIERTITYGRKMTCKTCDGTGQKDKSQMKTCPSCNGTGQSVHTQQTNIGILQQISTCSRCRGTGKIIEQLCPICTGQGRLDSQSTITFTVPSGIEENMSLTLSSHGNQGKNGGRDGNLLINVRIKPHYRFKRQGRHLFSTEKINYLTAILGGDIEIETVEGYKKLYIHPGTQPNESIKLQSNGLPEMQTKIMGDLNVTIQIEIPKKLTDKEKLLLEELKNQK